MAKDVPPVPRVALVDPATGRLTAPGQDFLERLLTRTGGSGNNVGWGGQVLVHRNGAAQTGIVDATWTTINYTTAAIDKDGWFDLTNDRYIPKQKGWYYCVGHVLFNSTNTGANDLIRQRIIKNGTATENQTNVRLVATGSASCIVVSTPIEFNGDTDYVEHEVRIDGAAGNTEINGGRSLTNFKAWRWL